MKPSQSTCSLVTGRLGATTEGWFHSFSRLLPSISEEVGWPALQPISHPIDRVQCHVPGATFDQNDVISMEISPFGQFFLSQIQPFSAGSNGEANSLP